MLCDDLRAYLDNEISGPAAIVMAVHSRVCPVCRENAAAWSRLSAEIRSSGDGPELPVLRERLMADARASAASAREEGLPRPSLMPIYAGMAAVLLMLALVGRTGFKNHPSAQKRVSVAARHADRADTGNTNHVLESMPQIDKPIANISANQGRGNRKLRRVRTARHHLRRYARRNVDPPRTDIPTDLRVEWRVQEDASEVVLAVGSLEQKIQNKIVPLPPDPDASEIRRPALRTVVSINPIPRTASEM